MVRVSYLWRVSKNKKNICNCTTVHAKLFDQLVFSSRNILFSFRNFSLRKIKGKSLLLREPWIIFASLERKCRTEPHFSVNRINVSPTENRVCSWLESLDLHIPVINWQKQSAKTADSISKLFRRLFYNVHSPAQTGRTLPPNEVYNQSLQQNSARIVGRKRKWRVYLKSRNWSVALGY